MNVPWLWLALVGWTCAAAGWAAGATVTRRTYRHVRVERDLIKEERDRAVANWRALAAEHRNGPPARRARGATP